MKSLICRNLAACGALAVCLAANGAAASSGLTEWEAGAALHFGYALEDLDQLNELESAVAQAEAEAAGLTAEGADPSSIAVALANAESARIELKLETRGHPLVLEDCLGLGKGVGAGLSERFAGFRCQMSSITNSGYLRETEVFTASELRRLMAVPRPQGKAAWKERVMADRLVSHARMPDPMHVLIARQDLRYAEEELAALRAEGASQRSLDLAAARVREAKISLANALVGVKLRSATCRGVGEPGGQGFRGTFTSFRCRVSARVPGQLLQAFMVAEARSPSRLVVRSVRPLAPLT